MAVNSSASSAATNSQSTRTTNDSTDSNNSLNSNNPENSENSTAPNNQTDSNNQSEPSPSTAEPSPDISNNTLDSIHLERYRKLLEKIESQGYLLSQDLIQAFKTTPRKRFLPKLYKKMANINAPLPLKNGQTTSQPLTISFMLELLELAPGQKVLEIGYGSAWQTALISKIIMPDLNSQKSNKNSGNTVSGEIYAYEITPKIATLGKENLQNNLSTNRLDKIHLHQNDYKQNCQKFAPFDRIISGAAFSQKPSDLISSLKPSGIMVYPTKLNEIRRIIRNPDQQTSDKDKTNKSLNYVEETFPGFTFVPIIHKQKNS